MSEPQLSHQLIIDQLTQAQRQCVLDLTTEWRTSGFSIIQAALIWATDDRRFPGRFPPLVECSLYQMGDHQACMHRYRLTDLGLNIQFFIKGTVV